MGWLVTTLALAACGDSAMDGGFQGRPLDRIALSVSFADEGDPIAAQFTPVVALLWLDAKGKFIPGLDEGRAVLLSDTDLTVEVVREPEPAALITRDDIINPIAFGQVVIYADADDDRRWSNFEPILAVTDGMVVAFAPSGASGDDIGVILPGFHHLEARACPELPRLSGDLDGAVQLRIMRDADDKAFRLECPASDPFGDLSVACSPLKSTRLLCRRYPDILQCERCAPLVYDAGLDEKGCAVWFDDCMLGFPTIGAQCKTERTSCEKGLDECDGDIPCMCDLMVDDCHEHFSDNDCTLKFGNCLDED